MLSGAFNFPTAAALSHLLFACLFPDVTDRYPSTQIPEQTQ